LDYNRKVKIINRVLQGRFPYWISAISKRMDFPTFEINDNLTMTANHTSAIQIHPASTMDAIKVLASSGYLHDGNQTDTDVGNVVRKPFCIRIAENRDTDLLESIEITCWGDLRLSRNEIENRMMLHPHGQWVATVEGNVVGAMYTQRVYSVDALICTTFDKQHLLHNTDGKIVQLLGVAVLPEYASLQISQALRDFVVRLAWMDPSCTEVVAMTRCSSITESIERYHEKIRNIDDPTLQFHVSGGAVVVAIVPDFRSNDYNNFGHAIMIQYNLDKSLLKTEIVVTSPLVSATEKLTSIQLCNMINDICGKTLHPDGDFLNAPFMILGLDSLRIMEFRSKLMRFPSLQGVKVSQSIVFDYPTPQRLLAYVNSSGDEQVTSPSKINKANKQSNYIICGASCRFPGGANDLKSFFQMLQESAAMLQPIPDAWKTLVDIPTAGFLDDNIASTFDPIFFGISKSEAMEMDPHQRLLLEVSYEAMNEANVLQDKDKISVGVFIGLCNNEWTSVSASQGEKVEDITAYTGICTAQSAAANRISYTFGLTGPSMVIDTACSSSLAAFHVALQSLIVGDCDVAVVAAADLLISPHSLQVYIELLVTSSLHI
jgi:hypothetical protein